VPGAADADRGFIAFQIGRYRAQSVTLVNTLLDAHAYPAEELARLYVRRWRIELWFHDIKTSMGMEVLRCKVPRCCKELECFHRLRLIRCLMAEAGAIRSPIERLSFKTAIDRCCSPLIKKGLTRSRLQTLPGRRGGTGSQHTPAATTLIVEH
jgi:hypothetical protein